MQMIRQGNDPEPIGVLFMLPSGEIGVLSTADGRTHEMYDGRVFYDLGDCNALAQARPVDLSKTTRLFVDEDGIIRRA